MSMIEQLVRRQSVLGSVTNLGVSAGTLSSNLSAITFANSNGVTFGLNTNGVITASAAGGGGGGSVKFSAGTLSSNRTDITFSNSNGVSFGLDTNGVITATVATNYQSAGAYLTTAMASNRGSDFVQATAAFAGTNASGTINSTGISVSVAAPSAQSINVSAGTTSSNVTAVTFSNANGVSFGYDGTNVTATVATNYQSQGAYLTTAALSQDSSKYAGTGFTTATTAGTAIVGTHNTAGLSMGVPAYITTAMQSNAATISNIKISAGASSSNVSAVTFSNANGVSFGYDGTNVTATVATNYQSQGAYLTTAALSQDSSKYAGTGTSATNASITLNTAGLAISVAAGSNSSWTVSDAATSATVGRLAFTNSNGLTLSLSTSNNGNHTVIGSYTVPTVTNSSWTVSDAATSMTIGRLAFTNSNGLTLTLSTTTGGLATVVGSYTVPSTAGLISAIKLSAGTLSNNLSAVTFSDSNGISWGLNTNSVITASIATTYAGTGFTTATTAGTAIVGTHNTAGISMGIPAYITTADLSQNSSNYAGINSAITGGSMTVNTSGISVNIPIATLSFYENINHYIGVSSAAMGMQRITVCPFILPQPISIGFARFFFSLSLQSASQTGTSVNTSFTMNRSYTDALMILSQGTGANSLSLRYLTSTLATWVFQTKVSAAAAGSQYTVTYNVTYPTQGTTSAYTTSYATSTGQFEFNTTIMSLFSDAKWLDIPFAQSLSAGNYWMAFGNSTNFASNAGPANLSSGSVGFNMVVFTNSPRTFGFPGAASDTTNQLAPGMGYFTSGVACLSTSSIGLNQISLQGGNDGRMPFQLIRQA